jgi:ElaB/YqjD/DUF883 family membrane-anchored ribosome-binding protein
MDMMSSEQLERQTEQSRAEVELTIDELRARLTPGQLIDEILSYTRDGGRQFTSNLGHQVTSNPMPVLLIGAGLAWFLLGRDGTNGPHAGSRQYGAGNGTSGLKDAASKAGEAVHDAFGGVRHTAESAGSVMSDTAHKIGDSASSAYHAASATAHDLANSATAFEQKAMSAARDIIVQAKDQPLVIVGLGLAIGAAIGAAIPETDIENRTMGDIADEVKRDVREVASEQLHKGRDVAQRVVEDTANSRGNGPERAVERDHFG